MKKGLLRTAGLLGVATMAGGLALGAASRRWQAATERLADRVIRRAARARGIVAFDGLRSLPSPVDRYFRTVLREGQPRMRVAHIRQTGQFRSRESADTSAGWQPFTATQVFSAEPPGFVWDARIRMAPFGSVRVRDAYVEGRASMLGALMGVAPVVDELDSEELRAGSLLRYLAEAVWFPSALLPREGLAWSPIDDSHARATLTDAGTSVSLDFEFGPEGEILGAFTTGRLRSVAGEKGRYEELPWGGRYSGYEEHGGVRAPTESEVYWVVEGREQPYYRGRNVDVTFESGEAR